jgi:hypothetical protein
VPSASLSVSMPTSTRIFPSIFSSISRIHLMCSFKRSFVSLRAMTRDSESRIAYRRSRWSASEHEVSYESLACKKALSLISVFVSRVNVGAW